MGKFPHIPTKYIVIDSGTWQSISEARWRLLLEDYTLRAFRQILMVLTLLNSGGGAVLENGDLN
jgi:hypothetical protein